jgi:hypothetical protein
MLVLDREMTAERLLAHSIIFDEAAHLHSNKRVSVQLRRLAEACVKAALAIIEEMREVTTCDLKNEETVDSPVRFAPTVDAESGKSTQYLRRRRFSRQAAKDRRCQ